MASQPERPALQQGLLVRHSSGCLSPPRVLDFLCFDSSRPVLGAEGEDELPFYLADRDRLEEDVREGRLPCPALWMEQPALAAGSGQLRVLYRMGGRLQHVALPGKPIKLQPAKQAGSSQSPAKPTNSSDAGGEERGRRAQPPACRAFVSSRKHLQLVRLVVGLFPKLEQLHQEITSSDLVLCQGEQPPEEWELAHLQSVRATSTRQGVVLERLDGSGEVQQLTISIDFAHVCLVLKDAPGSQAAASSACLRTVNCLAEALAVLHRETGRLGPSLTASPIKSMGGRLLSPAKPPLPIANSVESLRMAVGLIQRCGSSQLREGLAILSSAVGSSQMCATAIGVGAMEALVTAAATVLPTNMLGMAELQPSLEMAVTSLLDAAPPAAYAAGRLVSILVAVLQQSCANPLLLCRLLVTLLQRADVRAEAMRQGLASDIAAMYVRLSPAAQAAAADLLPSPTAKSAPTSSGGSDQPADSSPQQPADEPAGAGQPRVDQLSEAAMQQQLQQLREAVGRQQKQQRGFGSPLAPGLRSENHAGASNKHQQVAHLISMYNAMSDSGSECSPYASRSASPTKGSPARSPSVLSHCGRFTVPRLALPSSESPTAVQGGLTRTTRRALSVTPCGTRSPSPYGSPTRRSGTCDSGEPAAQAELATLASALGESLMAADLPAIVAHKRQADNRVVEEEGEVPAELMETPTASGGLSGGRKVLEAHRILVTAKSLRSMDTSPTRTTDTEVAAPPLTARSGRQPLDTDQIKCLLLKALATALPLLDVGGWPAKDPSATLAAEVVGLVGKGQLSPQQDQLKGLAVQALLRLSQRPAPSSGAVTGCERTAHVLVVAAGRRLVTLAGSSCKLQGPARTEVLALLQLVNDYVSAVQQPSVAVVLVQYCLPALHSLLGTVYQANLDAACWNAPTWQLLHALVLLLTSACQKCQDGEAGRGIIGLLLADQQVAAMLSSAASHMLLQPEQPRSTSLVQRSRTAALQRDLLQLFAALATLIGRQPACLQPAGVQQSHLGVDAESAGWGGSRPGYASSLYDDSRNTTPQGPAYDLLLGLSARRGLTRRHALQFFGFLVSPQSGLAQRILDQEDTSLATSGSSKAQPKAAAPALPPSAGNVRLRQSLLELLKAVFAAPGSPFTADKFVSDFYIRFHFVQFLKLYHNPHRDHQALFLCRQHMDTLLVLAGNRSPHIRHRFHQLSVVDFFVRELSLEFETKQPARGRMHRLSSGGSALEHRRTASASTLAGCESGSVSPVMSLRLPTVPEPEQQVTPATVPLLQLPSRSAGGMDGGGADQGMGSSPAVAGSGSLGGRGLAVPRLNLGPSPSLPSPGGGQTTPSPVSSSRYARPPLPPSARSGAGRSAAATPRLTSRLGRSSARSADGSSLVTNTGAAAGASVTPPLPLAQSCALPAIATRPAANSGNTPPGAGSVPKLVIPKLVMGQTGRSLAAGGTPVAAAPGVPPPTSAGHDGRAASRVHFSPSPPRDLPSDDEDSDSDESSDGGEGPGGAAAASPGSARPGAGVPAQLLGLDVPPGFTFTGDLEEDLERLEALEEQGSDGECMVYVGDSEPTSSPTIPAMRTSPFQQAAVVPPLLGLPRVKTHLNGDHAHTPVGGGGGGGGGGDGDGSPQQAGSGGERGAGMPVPRLNLTQSMHSTFEARNAMAEIQLAVDAEQVKARQGRSVLGELERSALGKGKMQAASFRQPHNMADLAGSAAPPDLSYSEERGRRLLYRDEGLHLEVLQLVFTLIFNAEGQLDATYCDQYPWDRKLQNIPFILYHHLNHEDNRPLLPHLLPRLHAAGQPALRMLRVMCAAFFRPEWYCGRARISNAAGAYSTVYRATLPAWAGDGSVVLKLVDIPKHIQDRCAQVDFQAEVSILDALAGSPRACQMHDYGVDPTAEAMFLVLKDYRCSLRQWRAKQPSSPAGHLRLYYSIFAEVAAAVGALLDRGVVHFDLKCDNCLLEPLPGISESEFWAPSSERLPFRVVLADFGESKAFNKDADAVMTSRARGTDCFKSPEMLMVGGANHKEQRFYDRRRRQGAGPASDVWSLGCLLFELVTGKLLFSDSDWLQLVARVTSPTMPLVSEDKAALVSDLPGILDLLHFMLVRDARMRPSLADVQARLSAIRNSSRVRLPPHTRAPSTPHSSRGTPTGLQPSSSQLFSPTSYIPSPKSSVPMPLLAALPLSGQLVLAPMALLSSTAALKQHAARRVVLLFGPVAGYGRGSPGPRRQLGKSPVAVVGIPPLAGSVVRSPGSPGGSSISSLNSSPARSALLGPAEAAGTESTYTGGAPLAFSMGGGTTLSQAASSSMPRPTARTFSTAGGTATAAGTPRTARRPLSCAAVHPEPSGELVHSARGENVAPLPGTAAAAGGGIAGESAPSTARQLSARSTSARVHPAPLDGAAPLSSRGRLVLPLHVLAPNSARGLASGRPSEDVLLSRVLSDPELAAAASSCAAAGVECRLALVHPAGSERGMQLPLALAQWLTQQALPLLNGGSGQQLPVLLAVQAGCEAEGAMAAVAHLMQQRQATLYQAMVAASQWGIDLHLRQQHLLALQHWASTNDGASSARVGASWQ